MIETRLVANPSIFSGGNPRLKLKEAKMYKDDGEYLIRVETNQDFAENKIKLILQGNNVFHDF